MTAPVSSAPVVRIDDLRVGDLLAEGGEGRVHQLPRQPHLVFKSYRRPADRSHLEELVCWPATLASEESATTVAAASAWPCAVVAGDRERALGLLMPRAPRRFSLRHRDGRSRLASLSYLTADPGHRAVAYGLQLPAPASMERIGLVHALVRLLAAFEAGEPHVGHGDLSTKNVLWSLERGPEVFVIDCDNADLFTADGLPAGAGGRRRAMTPNWDDPAVPRGHNPLGNTDRYSLGLIFLRVVGAANFPIQARQRGGGEVEVRFPVPPGPAAEMLLDPEGPVWELCARSLSLSCVDGRPPASAWLRPLEALLGSTDSDAAGEMRGPVEAPVAGAPWDIRIIPERALARPRTWSRVSPALRYPAVPDSGRAPSAPLPASRPTKPPASPPMWPEVRAQLGRFGGWWVSIHRALWRALRGPRRGSRRLRRAVLCVVVDFAMLVLGSATVALIVSPIIQG